MRTRGRIWLVAGMLTLLVGCGGPPTAAEQTPPTPAMAAQTAIGEVVTPPSMTEAPAQTSRPASSTAEAPEPPADGEGTAQAQTATADQEPSASAEEPPSDTASPADPGEAAQPSAYGLRRDSVWIATGQRVIGLSEGQPEMPISTTLTGVRVAPDGSRVVYNAGEPGTPSAQLMVQSTQTGEVTQLAVLEGGAINPVFSPDSGQLAYTWVNNMHGWQLNAVDLQSGEARVLQGSVFAEGQPMSVLVPQQWTPAGLIVSRVGWFGETNTSGLYHVDPVSGEMKAVWEQGALSLQLSPDGSRVAAVAGSLPMGGPGNMTLSVVDIASGQVVVAREQLVGLWTPEWSPDSAMLAYVDSAFESGASTLSVFNADGSAVGELRFGPSELPGMLRDIAWRDNETLLLIVVDGNRVVVSEIAARDLAEATPRELASFDVEMGPGTPHEVVYVPR